MKKNKKLLLASLIVIQAVGASGEVATAAEVRPNGVAQEYRLAKSGWVNNSGSWRFIDTQGRYKTGWLKDKGSWYFMNPQGVMQTGWQKVNNQWYYMNSSGRMLTGWQKVNNQWYYMNSSGKMLTGWQKINNQWYYMNSSGKMYTGWLLLGDKQYYLQENGVMFTGVLVAGDREYTFNNNGELYNSIYIETDLTNYNWNVTEFNEEMLRLINIERQKLGLNRLVYDRELQKGVNIRTQEISVKNFSHTRPNGDRFYTAYNYIEGANSKYFGENIAYRFLTQDEGQAVKDGKTTYEKLIANRFYKMYYNSEGHYQNMMGPAYRKIAVGVFSVEDKVSNAMVLTN